MTRREKQWNLLHQHGSCRVAVWRFLIFLVVVVSVVQRISVLNLIAVYVQEVSDRSEGFKAPVSGTTGIATEAPRRNSGLFLLQIGANDGSAAGNDRIVQSLLQSNKTAALLVEANPQVFPLLQQNIPRLYQQPHRIRLANALISTSGGAANATFYVVDYERLSKDAIGKPLPHWVKYQLGSMMYGTIHRSLNSALRSYGLQAADYIVTMEIPFHSWTRLLQEYNISPSLVDVLAIDTEGMDAKLLLGAFSEMEGTGWRPGIVIFEQKNLERAELQNLIDMFTQNDYKVSPNCTRPHCPDDLVAVHRTGVSFARILAEFPEEVGEFGR